MSAERLIIDLTHVLKLPIHQQLLLAAAATNMQSNQQGNICTILIHVKKYVGHQILMSKMRVYHDLGKIVNFPDFIVHYLLFLINTDPNYEDIFFQRDMKDLLLACNPAKKKALLENPRFYTQITPIPQKDKGFYTRFIDLYV